MNYNSTEHHNAEAARIEGFNASKNALAATNPYAENTSQHAGWRDGWDSHQSDANRERQLEAIPRYRALTTRRENLLKDKENPRIKEIAEIESELDRLAQ